MALRAKRPEAIQKRLKLFMFGPAGIGKQSLNVLYFVHGPTNNTSRSHAKAMRVLSNLLHSRKEEMASEILLHKMLWKGDLHSREEPSLRLVGPREIVGYAQGEKEMPQKLSKAPWQTRTSGGHGTGYRQEAGTGGNRPSHKSEQTGQQNRKSPVAQKSVRTLLGSWVWKKGAPCH